MCVLLSMRGLHGYDPRGDLLYREQRDWEDREEGRKNSGGERRKRSKGRTYLVIDPCSHLLRGHG